MNYVRVVTITIDFTGRTVLVTGGTRGIGRGIAERFAEAGAQIAVCARTPVDLPVGWSFHAADLRDASAAAAMIADVVAAHGRLDVLVNNAGGSPPADTATVSPRFTERIVALNLFTAIHCSQAAHPHLGAPVVQADGGGSIINISSVGAIRPAPTIAAYGAAKAALTNFTATIGQEWAPAIRTNCVTVGMVRTGDSDEHYGGPEGAARIAATIPIGRMATAADVADACLFLGSPLASYISGANLVLHGGGDRPPFLDAAAG